VKEQVVVVVGRDQRVCLGVEGQGLVLERRHAEAALLVGVDDGDDLPGGRIDLVEVVVGVVGDEESALVVERHVLSATDRLALALQEHAGEDGAGRRVDGQEMVRDRVGVVAKEGVQDAGPGLEGEAADVVADVVEDDACHHADDGDHVWSTRNGGRDVEGHEHGDVLGSKADAVPRDVAFGAVEGEGFEVGADVAERPVVVPLERAVAGERRRRLGVVTQREELAIVLVDTPERWGGPGHGMTGKQERRGEKNAGNCAGTAAGMHWAIPSTMGGPGGRRWGPGRGML
jgi:hypothetical protein